MVGNAMYGGPFFHFFIVGDLDRRISCSPVENRIEYWPWLET